MKFFVKEKGIGVISVIIFLLILGVISGGLYYYFQKQTPSDIGIVQAPSKEKKNIVENAPVNEILPEEVLPSVACQNGECIDQCISNYTKKCDGDNIYWYDSCGKRLDQIEKCGIDLLTEQYQCSSDKKYTQKEQQTSSCILGVCQPSYSWENIEDCSSMGKECSNGACVQKKCTDGTFWAQCSVAKPLYCENGTLVERTTLCGCPSGYEVYGTQCREKLAKECGILYEGAQDYSDAVNFVIVPADSLYGMLLDDPNSQYSNNINAFIADANKNINDFFSVDPMSKYRNIFNFYYTTNVVECNIKNGQVVCDLWEEVVDGCNIPYDVAIVFQRKEGGGICCKPIETSAFTSGTFIHEISHYFGIRDYNYLAIPFGPNHCNDLSCCGGEVCEFESKFDNKPIEDGGPECCLYQGELDGIPFYIPNEQSLMNYDIRYKAFKFNYLEKAYLEKLFSEILSSGKESVRCGTQRMKLEEYCQPIIQGKTM